MTLPTDSGGASGRVFVVAGSAAIAEAVAARIPGARTLVARPDRKAIASTDPAGEAADAAALQHADVVIAADDAALSRLERRATELGSVPVIALIAGPQAVARVARVGLVVAGVLGAGSPAEQLQAAIAAVRAGLRVHAFDAQPGARVESPRAGVPPVPPVARPRLVSDPEPLTGRERDVLALLAMGARNRAIAQRLGISEHTVKFHVASILGKLGVSTRTQAVREALRRGLVTM